MPSGDGPWLTGRDTFYAGRRGLRFVLHVLVLTGASRMVRRPFHRAAALPRASACDAFPRSEGTTAFSRAPRICWRCTTLFPAGGGRIPRGFRQCHVPRHLLVCTRGGPSGPRRLGLSDFVPRPPRGSTRQAPLRCRAKPGLLQIAPQQPSCLGVHASTIRFLRCRLGHRRGQ